MAACTAAAAKLYCELSTAAVRYSVKRSSHAYNHAPWGTHTLCKCQATVLHAVDCPDVHEGEGLLSRVDLSFISKLLKLRLLMDSIVQSNRV